MRPGHMPLGPPRHGSVGLDRFLQLDIPQLSKNLIYNSINIIDSNESWAMDTLILLWCVFFVYDKLSIECFDFQKWGRLKNWI